MKLVHLHSFPFLPILLTVLMFCCRYPTGIASLAFSPDGSVLAIASSYMYENDEPVEPAEDVIYIRNVSDQETKPKS